MRAVKVGKQGLVGMLRSNFSGIQAFAIGCSEFNIDALVDFAVFVNIDINICADNRAINDAPFACDGAGANACIVRIASAAATSAAATSGEYQGQCWCGNNRFFALVIFCPLVFITVSLTQLAVTKQAAFTSKQKAPLLRAGLSNF
jgi:hypothetical protein